MKVEKFIEIIGADFYTGVPDSQLESLCNYLIYTYGIDLNHHIIAANEGNCTALAAGYHLATGKVPVIYMQNSGEGNIINPVASLLNDNVYAIPVIFIIGWRGEPGIHDEPQHIYQGTVTLKLVEDMDIYTFVISKETTDDEIAHAMSEFRKFLANGKNVAFVIRKGALTDAPRLEYNNDNKMIREEIIQHIVKASGEYPIICTTGKASRELFETRVANGQSHKYDFLTVGSMGHANSIALGVAINKNNQHIWCVDGDGAVLMHMGSMAVLGANKPKNLIHVVINNYAHQQQETFLSLVWQKPFDALDKELEAAKDRNELSFVEIKCAIGAHKDLGRPTITALENKQNFMEYL